MKITVNFSALDRAVEVMEAKWKDFALNNQHEESDPGDTELSGGYEEVTINDVDITPSGLFSIKGDQVLLYIQDHGWGINEAIANPEDKGRKYHVVYCQTLEQMKNNGRYEKYVAKDDANSDFFITGTDYTTNKQREAIVKLKVCQNCLSKLNYKNYKSNRNEVFNAFSLQEFFKVYQSHFKYQPRRKAGNAKDDTYTEDWKNISKEYRTSVGWGCEKCGVILNENKSLLHTHHKNGVKSDNLTSNLAALCILCHSEEPNHGHMTRSVTFEKRNKIIRLRREQKLT